MERWENKVAVVTGSSSGIGAAIAKDLVENGLQVIGLARRVKKLQDLHDQLPVEKRSHFMPMECDVGDVNSVNAVFDDILKHFGGIDILVNNAGTGGFGQLVSMSPSEMQQILQTNVMGIVHCTQRAFSSMKERNFPGHIILINSIYGHKFVSMNPVPDINMYCPSKYAVTSMRDIFRHEFIGLGTKVKITSISPGLVDTEIVPEPVRAAAGECMLQTGDIVSAVLYTLSTPPHVQVHELIIKPLGESI
ncbi:farnesol dehydrogenase-like [Haematobia irritans]|uniref:farnesol dehydrogenase-like n=1 Tax=Haematobia irritans TaxID=7368 RepID=UPI003F50C3CC